MPFPFQQIQSTVKFLVYERLAGWKPEKRGGCLETGTIVDGRYRMEEHVQRDGSRNLYVVSLVGGGEICHSCRLKDDDTRKSFCDYCESKLRQKIFQMEIFPGRIDPGMNKRLLEISHPGVAKIYDIFSVGFSTYVVSEHTQGTTLDRLEGIFPAEQIRRAGIYLTQTVEFLHGHGIYHINLQPLNLKLVGDRPRLISLSECRLKDNLSRKDTEWVDPEDFRGLLETLERLAAEYVDQGQKDVLCRLLVAFEEMIGKQELCAKDIQTRLSETVRLTVLNSL